MPRRRLIRVHSHSHSHSRSRSRSRSRSQTPSRSRSRSRSSSRSQSRSSSPDKQRRHKRKRHSNAAANKALQNSYKKKRRKKNPSTTSARAAVNDEIDEPILTNAQGDTSHHNTDVAIHTSLIVHSYHHSLGVCKVRHVYFSDVQYAPEYIQDYVASLMATFKQNIFGFDLVKKGGEDKLAQFSTYRPTLHLSDGSLVCCELLMYITWTKSGRKRDRAVPGLLVSLQKDKKTEQKCITVEDLVYGFSHDIESQINCVLMLHDKYKRDLQSHKHLVPHPVTICGSDKCNANSIVACSDHYRSLCFLHFNELNIPDHLREQPPVLNSVFCKCHDLQPKPSVVAVNDVQTPVLVFNYNFMSNRISRSYDLKHWTGIHDGFDEFSNVMICPGYVSVDEDAISQIKHCQDKKFIDNLKRHSTHLLDRTALLKPNRIWLSYIFHTKIPHIYLGDNKVTTLDEFIVYLNDLMIQMAKLFGSSECIVSVVGCDLAKYENSFRALPKCKNHFLIWTARTTKFEDFILFPTQMRLQWQDHNKSVNDAFRAYIPKTFEHVNIELVSWMDEQHSNLTSLQQDGSIQDIQWNKITFQTTNVNAVPGLGSQPVQAQHPPSQVYSGTISHVESTVVPAKKSLKSSGTTIKGNIGKSYEENVLSSWQIRSKLLNLLYNALKSHLDVSSLTDICRNKQMSKKQQNKAKLHYLLSIFDRLSPSEKEIKRKLLQEMWDQFPVTEKELIETKFNKLIAK